MELRRLRIGDSVRMTPQAHPSLEYIKRSEIGKIVNIYETASVLYVVKFPSQTMTCLTFEHEIEKCVSHDV